MPDQMPNDNSRVYVGELGAMELARTMADSIVLDFEPSAVPRPSDEVNHFRGIGFHDAAHHLVESEIGRAPREFGELLRSAMSTNSFPALLSNASTKILSTAFRDYPDTTGWVGKRPVKDFKDYTDIKVSAFANLEVVGHGGQLVYDDLTEQSETYRLKTYGKRFALSREMFINDDLEAFMEIPQALGQAARRTRIEVVYSLLLSGSDSNGPTLAEGGKQLFATDHEAGANYWAHADAALSMTGLDGGKARMRKLKGLRGEHINVMPRYLLVPPELEGAALRLVTSETVIGADSVSGDRNIHQGTLKVIVEPRLSQATNGATAWYLFADPRVQKCIVGLELRGANGPVVELRTPADILGEGWIVYDDYAAAAVDPRGGFRSKGAA